MRHWVCPLCQSGSLLPVSPDADDARRFCLPCTAKTGKLTRRVCPTAVRAREEGKEARRRRAAAARGRTEAREWTKHPVAGLDVREVAKRCWRTLLPIVRERKSHLMLEGRASLAELITYKVPLLWVTRVASGRSKVSTVYGPQAREVKLRFARATTDTDVWVLVLCGLTHFAVGRHDYGKEFRQGLDAAVKRLWGFKLGSEGTSIDPPTMLFCRLRDKFAKAAVADQGK